MSKEDAREIIIDVIKFCVCFLTISGNDSKDAIQTFKDLCEYYHTSFDEQMKIDKKHVIYKLSHQLEVLGIRREDLANSLSRMNLYDKNRQLSAAVILIYESRYDSTVNKNISWDTGYSKYSTYGTESNITLDHIMNQTPDKNDENLSYYPMNDLLKLKEGHDFPTNLVYDGMEYDKFKDLVLHRAGNLRLMGGDNNSSRGQTSDISFKTYKQLDDRSMDISNFIINEVFKLNPNNYFIDVSKYIKTNKRKLAGTYKLSETDIVFTGNKPKQITFNNQKISISTNREILTTIIKKLYCIDKGKMNDIAQSNWSLRARVAISKNPNSMTAPKKYHTKWYICRNKYECKRYNILYKKLCELYNVDLSSIEITY